ncbi:MAG: serine hydrolase domain-containing protein, partial [Coprococcus sp.]
MDFRFPIRSIEVIGRLLNQQTDKINKITYTPQKPLFDVQPANMPLPRQTPEKTGISSSYMEEFFRALCHENSSGLHGVMVLRQGSVIAEASYAPYCNDIPHITHSLSKSITALAVGLAIDEGRLSLNDKIIDIFSDEYNFLNLNILRMKDLTVEHLLTMSSGVQFNEMGAVTADDWIKGYLDAALAFEPGSRFQYNSMNTFMLSAAIEKRCGCPVSVYLKDRLFNPLGIRFPYWEKSPFEIEKGGWGLSLCIEDMAKIGQLLLQKGRWQDRQLIPAEWIALATSQHIETPDEMNPYGYGYHFWICPGPDAFCCNGMLGQNIIVLPATEMVIVTTGGCSQLFPEGPLVNTVLRYFGGEADTSENMYALPADPSAHNHLIRYLNTLQSNEFLGAPVGLPRPDQRLYLGGWRGHQSAISKLPLPALQIVGHTWQFKSNIAGIMPLCLQCMHNNYTQGISHIRFDIRDGRLLAIIQEGDNLTEMLIGFGTPAENIFSQNGEDYRTAVLGRFTHDEDNHLVLKLEIAFTETSSCRLIKCFFDEDKIRIILDELPHMQDIVNELEKILGPNTGMEFLTDSMKGISDLEYTQYRMKKIFKPVLTS